MVNGVGSAIAQPAARGLLGMTVAAITLLSWVLLSACPVLAEETTPDAVTSNTYGVEEAFRVHVDAVGNVDYEDVLVYDREFFDSQSATFEEYPFLLSRRYRAMEQVDEIQDFRADLDKANATVTLTFRETGRAYNLGGYWIMYGFGSRPSKITGSEVVIEEETTENSDFTLWQDLEFKTTTYIALPNGAADVRWDEGESALVWEVPSQTAALDADQRNALQSNQAVFIPLFAVLMAGSLGAVLVVLARGRRPNPAAASSAISRPHTEE